MTGNVYLLHFDTKLKHAGHYIGFSKEGKTEERIEAHRNGQGARLMAVIRENRIGFQVAKIWKNVDRSFERILKNREGARRSCPICINNKNKNNGSSD